MFCRGRPCSAENLTLRVPHYPSSPASHVSFNSLITANHAVASPVSSLLAISIEWEHRKEKHPFCRSCWRCRGWWSKRRSPTSGCSFLRPHHPKERRRRPLSGHPPPLTSPAEANARGAAWRPEQQIHYKGQRPAPCLQVLGAHSPLPPPSTTRARPDMPLAHVAFFSAGLRTLIPWADGNRVSDMASTEFVLR